MIGRSYPEVRWDYVRYAGEKAGDPEAADQEHQQLDATISRFFKDSGTCLALFLVTITGV